MLNVRLWPIAVGQERQLPSQSCRAGCYKPEIDTRHPLVRARDLTRLGIRVVGYRNPLSRTELRQLHCSVHQKRDH
jgi:hypothetical protein